MTYTLYADGRSDEVLIPLLTWSLRRLQVTPVTAQFVDFDRLPRRDSDKARLKMILDLYPCDLLFVHRDAESQPHQTRRAEIAAAMNQTGVRHVPVVPVRMTEAWLLTDEKAIRSAAGNPRGTEELNLPDSMRIEALPNPKKVLHDALTAASGLNARRRQRLNVHQRVRLIPNYIDDYSSLFGLPAFELLQMDIQRAVGQLDGI